MNIIFVTTLYPSSTSQNLVEVPYVLHYLVRSWIENNHNVTVFKVESTYPKYIPMYSRRNKDRYERFTNIDDVPVHILPIKKKINREFSRVSIDKASESALNIIEKNKLKCDIVIFHVFEPSYFIANSIKQYFEVPLIAGVHQSDENWIMKKNNLEIFKEKQINIDGFAFRSSVLQRKFEKHIDPDKLKFIVTSGVNINDTLISRNSLKQKKDRSNTKFIVVSNLIKRKNIKLVITAFKRILEKYPTASLRIVGDGVEKRELELYTKKIKLKQQVEFMGYQSRETVFKYLEIADVFVLPSVKETFGMVYMEAMAKGCITIGTVNEGIDGIIKNGENGFLCEPNDEQVYECMEQAIVMSNVKKREMIEKSYKTVIEYSEENSANQYLSNLSKLL